MYISLSELAKKLGINKSALHYWTKQNLISPEMIVSKMFLFDEKKTTRILKELKKI